MLFNGVNSLLWCYDDLISSTGWFIESNLLFGIYSERIFPIYDCSFLIIGCTSGISLLLSNCTTFFCPLLLPHLALRRYLVNLCFLLYQTMILSDCYDCCAIGPICFSGYASLNLYTTAHRCCFGCLAAEIHSLNVIILIFSRLYPQFVPFLKRTASSAWGGNLSIFTCSMRPLDS